ncbi:hypothetical protein ABK040_000092 [Willaertia magna]
MSSNNNMQQLQMKLMVKEIECETLKQKLSAIESHPLSFLKHEKWDENSQNVILQQRFQQLLLYIQQLESEIDSKNRRIDLLEISLNNKKKRKEEKDVEQNEKLKSQQKLVKAFAKRKKDGFFSGSNNNTPKTLSSSAQLQHDYTVFKK